MKKAIYIDAISALLIILFVYTGVTKLITLSTFYYQLMHQPLTKKFASVLMIGVPLVEIVISAALLFPRTRRLGLYASFILMSLFTLYVAYILFILPDYEMPCSCGGIMRQLSWRQHMVFNSVYTLLAFVGIVLNRNLPLDNNISNNSVQLSS